MPNCSVLGCKKRTGEKYSKPITFHRFPTNDERRSEWLLAINRSSWTPSKHSVICSVHFNTRFFDRSANIVRLFPYAVPQIVRSPAQDIHEPLPSTSTTVAKQVEGYSEDVSNLSSYAVSSHRITPSLQRGPLSSGMPLQDLSLPSDIHVKEETNATNDIDTNMMANNLNAPVSVENYSLGEHNYSLKPERDDIKKEETVFISEESTSADANMTEPVELYTQKKQAFPYKDEKAVEERPTNFKLEPVKFVPNISKLDKPKNNVQSESHALAKKINQPTFLVLHPKMSRIIQVVDNVYIFPEAPKLHTCSVCSGKFPDYTSLKSHKYKFHRERKYPCPICGLKFKQRFQIKKHLISHSSERAFKCDACGATFKSRSTFSLHVKRHNKEFTHTCDECNKGFVTESEYKAHKAIHSGEIHKCEHCDRVFKNKPYYLQHLNVHKPDYKPSIVTCPICNAKMNHKSHLKRHMRIHDTEPKHICDVCGKNFSSAYRLKIHFRVHSGEKPYLCNICGNGFPITMRLKEHLRTHTKEKPYACTICQKSFTQSISLKVHMRKHTGEKPYKCNICQEGFITRQLLKIHLNKTHATLSLDINKEKKDLSHQQE